MVLAALAFQPEEFAVGVDIFGVVELAPHAGEHPALLGELPRGPLQGDRRPGHATARCSARSRRCSTPSKIRRPLLVLQGQNDPRVIKPESDDIVAAVKKNGVPVEYIVFPDEGHGFTKKKNRIEGYRAVLGFLDEHLKGEGKRSGRVDPARLRR